MILPRHWELSKLLKKQTAEGALAVKTAADWFNGKEIPAITNIPQHIITPADVESFYTPQW